MRETIPFTASMRSVEITTWYLEMTAPGQLKPSPPPDLDLRVEQVTIPCPEFSRFLYTTVGGNWYWLDRLNWSYAQWMTYLDRSQLQTWVAYVAGNPAGYVELEAQPERNVEIVYFGLLPQFIGRRLGGHLLSIGVERAWQMGAKRVWVHTCNLDGAYALANYQARGFQLYRTEIHQEEIPNQPIGPWQGHDRK